LLELVKSLNSSKMVLTQEAPISLKERLLDDDEDDDDNTLLFLKI